VTTLAEVRAVKMAYKLGANSFLVKPSKFEDLEQMLRVVYEYWCRCEKPPVPGSET